MFEIFETSFGKSARVEEIVKRAQGGRDEQAFSSRFLAAIEGRSAWSQEAREVVALAARRHLALDEELLALCDVRDLQALHAALGARFGVGKAA